MNKPWSDAEYAQYTKDAVDVHIATGKAISFKEWKASKMQALSGHVSPETAYLVDDYPFGFKLRCKIRYWVEFKASKGFRCVSQTTNPRRGNLIWNKPKAGTYSRFGGALYLDSQDRVQFSGLSEYSTGQEAADWQAKFAKAMPEAGRKVLAGWVAAKLAYDANRNKSDDLSKGLPEARAAFVEAVTKGDA